MRKIIVFIVCIQLLSCSQKKLTVTDKDYKKQSIAYAKILKAFPIADSASNTSFVGTTNFNMRKPNFVIIHHTAQNSCEQTLKTFTLKRTEVSAHYVVCRNGTIYHILNDYLRAWHGGAAKWGNLTDINSSSIGIELDNNGFEPFAEAQLESLEGLLTRLKKAYSIPTANFIGHADIAPGRKSDPSKFFPWERFSKIGFGNWYNITNTIVPENFDYIGGLRIIGYDTRNEKNAISSFKLHFNNTDTTKVISELDKKIIIDLYKKY
jgi:N-acetylmuramoyl-L-alanine amidase